MITFVFSWVTLIQLLLAVVLPLLVAIVTKRVTSSRARGVWLALLSLITSILTTIGTALVTSTQINLFEALAVALVSFVISVGFHFGLWGARGPDGAPSISAKLIDNVGSTSS